jgi:hypothetical protein
MTELKMESFYFLKQRASHASSPCGRDAGADDEVLMEARERAAGRGEGGKCGLSGAVRDGALVRSGVSDGRVCWFCVCVCVCVRGLRFVFL